MAEAREPTGTHFPPPAGPPHTAERFVWASQTAPELLGMREAYPGVSDDFLKGSGVVLGVTLELKVGGVLGDEVLFEGVIHGGYCCKIRL